MNLDEIIKIISFHRREIEETYGVRIVGIFGSFARGEDKETSDINILIDLKEPIGLKFFELADYLEKLLGRKVDIYTIKALKQKPLLWESVERDIIYV